MTTAPTQETIDAVWRIESARLIAGLTRIAGDVALAEDLAQDAFVAALEQWPQTGIPDNPGAWLMTSAKRRGVDALRRRVTLERKQELIAHEQRILQQLEQPDLAAQVEDVEDDVLAQARVPFELPGRDELADRLSAVLEVIYLVFNEGYAATAGEHWTRPTLCEDAMRLGRILAALMPREAEVHGLLALMELQASRLRARVGPGGEPVLLADQDRARWDHLLVQRGLARLELAKACGGTLGPYTLQAAIAACHARARTVEETDWPQIVALYDALAALTGSPVVELNRAVAVTMAYGPEAGLELVDALADEPALRGYHHLPSVRGDILARLGRHEEARAEFARAAELCTNERERELLLARAAGEA